MELNIGIRLEENSCRLARPFQVGLRIVRIDARAPDRYQEGLRQPWDAEERGEMHERAVRGTDHHRGGLALRIQIDQPLPDELGARFPQPSQRQSLPRAAEAIDPFLCPL